MGNNRKTIQHGKPKDFKNVLDTNKMFAAFK